LLLEDSHGIALPGKMVGTTETRRTGTDNRHFFLSAAKGRKAKIARSVVSKKPLEGTDIDRLIELSPIAEAFARVVTDPPGDAGQRVILKIDTECLIHVAPRCLEESGWDIDADGAGAPAGSDLMNEEGALGTLISRVKVEGVARRDGNEGIVP
jgi:hypothetical protein